jgi:hypothetical protein
MAPPWGDFLCADRFARNGTRHSRMKPDFANRQGRGRGVHFGRAMRMGRVPICAPVARSMVTGSISIPVSASKKRVTSPRSGAFVPRHRRLLGIARPRGANAGHTHRLGSAGRHPHGFRGEHHARRSAASRLRRRSGRRGKADAGDHRDRGRPGSGCRHVVKAANAASPKRRYTAGRAAGQVRFLRRFLPESIVDKNLRKFNQLPALTLRHRRMRSFRARLLVILERKRILMKFPYRPLIGEALPIKP